MLDSVENVPSAPGVPELEDLPKNHGSEIMAVAFFTVPTFDFKVLFGFVVLAQRRREVGRRTGSTSSLNRW